MKKLGVTREFKNQLKKIEKSGLNFRKEFDDVIDLLRNGKILPEKYQDHKLKGNLKIFRECHLKNDLLLIYKLEKNTVLLIGIGTHSKLFD